MGWPSSAPASILLFAAPWAVRVVRLHRPDLDACTARARRRGGSGAFARTRPCPDRRRVSRHSATDRAGSPRRHPSPAGRPRHAARAWQRRNWPTPTTSTSTRCRELVNDAHRGAKEAIVELRDLARGIHPPALDIGLEGALSTLAARSYRPDRARQLLSTMRPTPAIEAIAYFCVAELLANVAQHANASQARITCAQHGRWLRLVVRDDGVGGARPSQVGSSSSGLTGLTDRVRAVDGRFDIVSPARRAHGRHRGPAASRLDDGTDTRASSPRTRPSCETAWSSCSSIEVLWSPTR